MQAKMLDLIKQGEIYLNHAPRHEKYALCQRIRLAQLDVDMLIIEARKRYWNKTREALQKYPEQSLAETDLISDIKVKNPTKYVPYVDLPPLSVALLRATQNLGPVGCITNRLLIS